MKIRNQVAITLGSILLIVFSVMGIALGKRLSEEASARELRYVQDGVQMVRAVLDARAQPLLDLAGKVAEREDMVSFAAGKKAAPSFSTSSGLPLNLFEIDGIILINRDRSVIHTETLHPQGVVPEGYFEEALRAAERISDRLRKTSSWRGLLALPGNPALVATAAIPDKDGTDHPSGRVFLIHNLGAKEISDLARRSQPGMTLSPLSEAGDDPGMNRALTLLLGGSHLIVERESGNGRGYGLLQDSAGNPLFVLSLPIPPDIREELRQEFILLISGILGCFILMFSAAFLYVRNRLLSPLDRLASQLDCLITLGKHRERIPLKGDTEIVQVGQQINELLDSLEETQQREKQASFRFEALVDNLPGVVYRSAFDDRWTKEYLTHAFKTLTGHEPKDFLPSAGRHMKSFMDVIHPEDLSRVREALLHSRKEDCSFEVRYRIIRKDRRIRWVLDRGRVIYDPTNFAHWIDGFLLDVTEEVEAEKCLFASEARYRDIFETSPVSLWIEDFSRVKEHLDQLKDAGVDDIEGHLAEHPETFDHLVSLFRVVDVNQKTVEQFGATDKRAFLDGFGPFIGEGSQDLLRRELTAIFKGDLTFQGEGINYDSSGRSIHVFVNWKVSAEANGYERVLLSLEDITARKNLERQLRYTSHHDPLTGLNNRAFIEHQMAVLDMAQLGPLGVISIDVDGLKLVNDCLGHSEGDELLRRTGAVLSRSFRESDYVARVGGDEFNVILPRCDFQGLQMTLQRLDIEIEQERADKSAPIMLSLSVGWAFRTKGTPSLTNLFIEADQRMYSRKISNREIVLRQFRQKIESCIDEVDLRTGGREDRLKSLIHVLAESMELSGQTRKNLELLARYHTLGTISLGKSTPTRSGHLACDLNSENCERLALRWQDLAPLAPVFGSLSERWDGQGMPGKLSGEAIPLEARIFAPLLALEEMVYNRIGGAYAVSRAFEEIEKRSETFYDPRVVKHLGSVHSSLRSLLVNMNSPTPGDTNIHRV